MVKQQKESHEGDDNPKLKKINSRKKKHKYARRKWLVPSAKVLKMLSQKHAESDAESEAGGGGGDAEGAVTPGSVSNGEGTKEFLSTGRTGRRNAMPDILGQHAKTGIADLPSRLESLTTKSDEAGTSGMAQSGPSTSQQQMG
ncbi:uncharacterized protein LOC130668149 [Microplitis mediator]|uniref:uncharacterized protein LOC130668149 n=1 Tax=Microplitis mediator TaxID=375433 RepID=UPI002554A411|nr:uncharacterized protein LOC130668149 [Microplitis mediator]XP_057326255.1 uncharacterized protein LOC130668149 [Microplitis mediator]XP_057326256.1 uncharacterized protein LOC130668149 [Microplitis mediator]XP_057326257.1 uncharacterized protein LOC130668149 [Microplitis mediator]XP_057326258.1 uncharacterized protein LOC130668149 [Microplitis mediator]